MIMDDTGTWLTMQSGAGLARIVGTNPGKVAAIMEHVAGGTTRDVA